jgi:acyl-CoA thioesterase FadM
MEQRVVNASTGDVKCIAHTIMVSFDPETRQSAPISEEWRSALSAFEKRQF